eukprot:6319550-Amphidinium_carterae.4
MSIPEDPARGAPMGNFRYNNAMQIDQVSEGLFPLDLMSKPKRPNIASDQLIKFVSLLVRLSFGAGHPRLPFVPDRLPNHEIHPGVWVQCLGSEVLRS